MLSARLGEPIAPVDDAREIEEMRLKLCAGICSKGLACELAEESDVLIIRWFTPRARSDIGEREIGESSGVEVEDQRRFFPFVWV